MIQFQYVYDSHDSLKSFLESEQLLDSAKKAKSILIQVYSAETGATFLKEIIKLIKDTPCYNNAIIVGATSFGEIINGKALTHQTVLGISFFESSELFVFNQSCEHDEYNAGHEIALSIDRIEEQVAGILLLTTPNSINTQKLFEGISSHGEDYTLFGGAAGDYGSPQESLVFSDDLILNKGAIAVVFCGDDLHIKCKSFLGWQALSQQMTITDCNEMVVRTIDDKPAFDIFAKYLGIKNDENFIMNVISFPLLIERDNEILARVAFAADTDGCLHFNADIKAGDLFRLGFCDPQKMTMDSISLQDELIEFSPQTVFLYSCCCRRIVLPGYINLEMQPIEAVAPTFGFYTYGELYGTTNNPRLLNSTMVVVGFREGDYIKKDKHKKQSRNIIDYLNDPDAIRNARNVARLVHFSKTITEELEQTNQMLKRLSVTDKLTGLYNRQKLDQALIDEFKRVERYDQDLSLIILDIDHFKSVNDTYGHLAGDRILIEISKILIQDNRKTDIIGRWGGEEFMILLPNTNETAALCVAEKIRLAIELAVFPEVGQITSSFGVTSYVLEDCIENLIYRADKALYKAKYHGRNQVQVI